MIRKRGDYWQVRVFAGRDPLTQKKQWVYDRADSEEQAKQREAELKAEVADGRRRGGAPRSVAELLDRWYAWRLTNGKDLSPGTAYNYRNDLDHRIKPALGKLPPRRLDVGTLDRFYAELRRRGGRCRRCAARARKGDKPLRAGERYTPRPGGGEQVHQPDCATGLPLAPSTIHQVHAILSAALQQALRWGWVTHNPARLATPPSVRSGRRAKPVPPEVAQAIALIDAATQRDLELGVFLRLASVLGSRRGELCSLRWLEVNFELGEVFVDSGVIQVPGQGLIDHSAKDGDADGRWVAVDDTTMQLLREHRTRAEETAQAFRVELAPGAYVFSHEPNSSVPIRPDGVSHRFAKLRDELGLTCRLHDLRHFMVTQLLAAGVELPTVAGRAGHSDGTVTLKVYGHALRARDQHAAKLMGDLLPVAKPEVSSPSATVVDEHTSTTGDQVPAAPTEASEAEAAAVPSGESFRVQRRVNPNGRVMVARQELRIGKAYAGKTVTIAVEDAQFRVFHDERELAVHPRAGDRPVGRINAYARR